jgi:putative ATP-dependent endonuclease of the OLD family
MRLKAIILENFRAYRERITIEIDDIVALIGKNDVGKSTVLEALEIFFNNQKVKIEAEDANQAGDTSKVVIGCVFDDLPEELILDATSTTNLRREFLVNQDGDLEIHQIFNCSSSKPKPKTFTIAHHPTRPQYNDLLRLKSNDLQKRFNELGLDPDETDLRVNSDRRQAIWNSIGQKELELREVEIAIDDISDKNIWSKIQEYLPLYELFQSDRASSDADNEVQDPLKLAIKEAIKEVEDQLETIKKHVERKVTEVARRTLEKLRDMDSDLADELTPQFKSEPTWTGFKLSLVGDDNIPINKRGSGIRRLILLNFFRAEAEHKTIENGRNIIYAIEEPETSQHPDHQRMLIEALLQLSEQSNCQVLLTTHVPALAGLVPVSSLRYVERENGRPKVTSGVDFTTRTDVLSAIANTLDVLPSVRLRDRNQVKVIVCVEGPNDVNFLYHISRILNEHDKKYPSLKENPHVVVAALGGGNLKHWVDYHFLKEFGLPEFHIYDRDMDYKYQPQRDKIRSRGDGSYAELTRKRSIENYLHPAVIKAKYNITVSIGDDTDVAMMIAQKRAGEKWATLTDENRSKAMRGVKKKLNDEVVSLMTYGYLLESDTEQEMIGWMKRIADYLNDTDSH